MNTNYIAIDLSKTSPGITSYTNGEYKCYFFNHRKKLMDFYYEKDNLKIIEIDFTEYNNIRDRIDVYDIIIETIFNIILEMGDDIKVGLEDYAYGAQGQGITGLAELRGALLYSLRAINVKVVEIPIGTWKKWFTGKGNASKMLSYEYFKKQTGVDLMKVFNLKLTSKKELPAPIPDIADSYGILSYMMKKEVGCFDVIGKMFDRI